MIKEFIKKALKSLRDPGRTFRERVFILLTILGIVAGVVALVGDIMMGENTVEIVALIATVVLIPMITINAVKSKRIYIAVRFIVIGLVFVLLPILFYFGGGIEGGGVIWIIFAYLYTGLVLSGIWRPIMLAIITFETCGFYIDGYFHPEHVAAHTRRMHYTDSLLSMIIVGIVCCLMVWFEEWMLKEENKKTKEEAAKVEDLVKSQSRFFSSMSHEIRTPINSILGLNEIILRQEDASDEILRDANNIHGAGRMLLALVNDILDVSKIEAGKMDIVPINYNLGSLISEIVNMIWLRAEEKGLELKIEVDPQIPAELFGDEVRIKQILVNLLNNAVKYTKDGTVTLHIEKEEYVGDEILLLFSVIDTGMGIKQDALPYLFDAFKRVDEEQNAKIEGTGLGLSIVKQLVELMDGKITVNSVYTQGSTFMVALRQKVTRPDAIGDVNIETLGQTKRGKKYEAGFTAQEARILIVDDNEMNLEVERKLLDGTLMTVDTATSGADALSMTLSEHYDIILMDHLMPEMDGIECMQAIRRQQGGQNNHTPVVVLTANAGSENRELYNSSGFDGYLVKPVSGKELEDMLLLHLPEVKVKRNYSGDLNKVQMNTARGYSRKIPILITTSTMCDLPKTLLDDFGIGLIPFWIELKGNLYADRIEAGPDEIARYIKAGEEPDAAPPTVAEFEDFFGKSMKKAHEVIHISLMSTISKEYENACEAARAYEDVRVFDSEFNSGAMGILVLLAHRMASQGRSVDEIVHELEKVKKNIRCTYVTDDIGYLAKRQKINKGAHAFMEIFGLSPMLEVRDGKLKPVKVFMGDTRVVYEKYLDNVLPMNPKPDTDFIMVEYVSLSAEEKEHIERKIRERFNFDHILFLKTSATMTINSSPSAFGISYLIKGDQPYSISQMLSALDEWDGELPDLSEDEEETESTEQESFVIEGAADHIDNRPEEEKLWYEKIEGIDPEVAIKNSGSEEALKTVLSIFYSSLDIRADEIEEFYEKRDLENYTIKVHALKSSSRLVGAVKLGEDAERLEFAGKENNLIFIEENTDRLLSDLRGYKEVLAPLFTKEEKEKESDLPEDKAKDLNEDFDRFLLESVYEAIKEGAENKDAGIIKDTLSEITDYDLPMSEAEKLDRIEKCLGSEDFDGILQICHSE